MAEDVRKFSIEELAGFNGENGAPAYIAYEGHVFDVTASKLWKDGTHMRRHPAGQDLTQEMAAAPHDLSVLQRFPLVGVLVSSSAPAMASAALSASGPSAKSLPRFLEKFLARHPFFLRHPHPMTVHFPIVFFICAPIFTLLFLATGVVGFETTALNCLAAGLLFCLIVIPTGLFTWWVNYGARPVASVIVKLVLSLCMFVDGLAAFIWRLEDASVVTAASGPNALYLALVLLLLPMVVVVAWFGATLTFPLSRPKRVSDGR